MVNGDASVSHGHSHSQQMPREWAVIKKREERTWNAPQKDGHNMQMSVSKFFNRASYKL